MFSKILNNRRFRMGSFATVLTVIFIAALIILNMIVSAVSNRYPVQIDLTTDKIYGLSDETIEYLRGLEKEVDIYVLATEDGFSSASDYFLQAKETIKKFPQYTSKVDLSFVDMAKDPSFESKYASYNIGTRDIIVECGSKIQIVKTSDLFTLQYDSSTGYSYIQGSRTDEAITSAIMNVTSDYTPKVTLLTAHSSFDATSFVSLLEQNSFEVITQDLLLEDIDPEAEVAILFAPSQDLDEDQLKKLDAFLDNDGQKGRSLLYFASASQPAMPAMEAFLSEWGIVMEDATVYETDYSRIYNYSPLYSIVDFVNEEILEDPSGYMLMPTARVMDTSFTERDGKTVEVLQKFGPEALAIPNDAGEDYNIEDAEAYAWPALVLSTLEKSAGKVNESGVAVLKSQVIVSASAASCESGLLSSNTFVNGKYYLNLINSVVGRDVSYSVTDKVLDTNTLVMTNTQILGIAAVFVIVIPAALLVWGIVVFMRRRHK
ncbi:MAG: GldG family protein [Oscillospiraceae bacterium]|nr:GldG family protein [Oscillospiraceae bacterium]